MANDRNHQPNKQGALMSLKWYMFVVSICSSCLKLLQVACTSCLPSLSLPVMARLLAQGDLGLYLYLYLFYCAYIFNSLEICAQILACIGSVLAYSILEGYVHKFYIFLFWFIWYLCLHIQFLEDMFTSSIFFSSDLYGIYACIFNSRRICAQVLYSSLLHCMGSVLAYSILGG